MSELFEQPARDEFKSESPIRAFTTWQVHGRYALGKGFRPSLAHIVTYLDAMLVKEHWRLVQVLEAESGTPSFLFERMATPTIQPMTTLVGMTADRFEFASEVTSNDPINPKHYGGRECADIGERLSANGYQILKYCWRVGKKDDPVQELSKAMWYAESERNLLAQYKSSPRIVPSLNGISDSITFFESRIEGQSQFTQNIARMLWTGYTLTSLLAIVEAICEHRFHLDNGRGLA